MIRTTSQVVDHIRIVFLIIQLLFSHLPKGEIVKPGKLREFPVLSYILL